MKIAPIDIAHKTFTRKVMGLDADEVTDFLRDIADQMEEIIRERNSLKETLRQKDLSIMEYRERDDALKQTLSVATKMSEQIRIDSEREGKLIVNDAQQKADMILKDSRDSLRRVYQEIAELKRARMQFEVSLRSLCQAHIAMLEQGHMLMPEPQVNAGNMQGAHGQGAGAGAVAGGAAGQGHMMSGGGSSHGMNQPGMHQSGMNQAGANPSSMNQSGMSQSSVNYPHQPAGIPPMGLGRPTAGKA